MSERNIEKDLVSFLLHCASLCELEVLEECKEQHCSGAKINPGICR